MKFFAVALTLVVAVSAVEHRHRHRASANPIRKVVNMLEALRNKVNEEGAEEEKLYKKFKCYCSKGDGDLKQSIEDNQNTISTIGPEIEEARAQLETLKSDVKHATEARSEARQAVKTAESLRGKEAKAYAALKADQGSDTKAMKSAIDALTKATGGAFLQTDAAARVQKLVEARSDMNDYDREDVMAFLSAGQSTEYAPQSGQIIGILKQMLDEMNADFAEATKTEEAAVKNFGELVNAKKKEIAAFGKEIESKSSRIGEIGVEIEQKLGALEQAERDVVDDTQFLKDLQENCGKQDAEHEANVKGRNEELVALGETIKILDDDDALEAFTKSTLKKSSSFMQVTVTSRAMKARALAAIRKARAVKAPYHGKLDLITLLLQSAHGASGFEKIIEMIDSMQHVLKEEQTVDDDKKGECEANIDAAHDMIEDNKRDLSSASKTIDDSQEKIKALQAAIKKLGEDMKADLETLEEANKQRTEAHAVFTQTIQDNTIALKFIDKAKNRMQKFYNPSLAKEEFVQVGENSEVGDKPGPPPKTAGPYQKNHEGGNAVVHHMDLLIKDIEKEMQTMEADEKAQQATHAQMQQDAQQKATDDNEDLATMNGDLAQMEGKLHDAKHNQKGLLTQSKEHHEELTRLHDDCDWLLKNHQARKDARAAEVDSLNNAKAVLSGADYSFVQIHKDIRATRRALRGGHL